jgi:molybdenum-dependent DNA-binding transcriptional regulator ModE
MALGHCGLWASPAIWRRALAGFAARMMKQAFVSSATQGGGKAGGAGINSFGQGLLERGERVFKCLAEGPAPPIGKRHEALNHLGRRLDV